MKYQVSVTENHAKMIERLIDLNPDSKVIDDAGTAEVMMVARARFDTGETACLLLKEGSVMEFVRDLILAWKAKIDCIRLGWPKNLVVAEG